MKKVLTVDGKNSLPNDGKIILPRTDTQDGATASALVYSIVETAKASEIDVYHYLKYLLLKPPTDQTPDDELEKLCPWNPECQKALNEMQQSHQQAIVDAK